jgi:outer membrane protein OmpA-like peptidoglycan-associated protein
MKKLYLLLMSMSFFWFFSQEYLDELPENPDPNKCFAKCVVPDEYREEVVRVQAKPEHRKLSIVPAVYRTESEEIVIRPESKRFVYEPAVYRTVVDTLWIKDPYHKLTVQPVAFSQDYESVEIKPLTGSWVAGEKDPDCPSIEPADCRIFHFVESPAVYRDVPIQKIVSKESTTAQEIKGNYRLITKQVEVSPAQARQEIIPKKTRTIERQVLVTDETTRETTVPAEYTEVVKKVLVKKGGMTAWREVPCTIPSQGQLLPIHYALGSAALTSTSKRIIDDYILSKMQSNKNILVEIGSHTDSRGGDAFNQSLSERRAKSVVEYLISKGIDQSRLIAVGYGEGKLLNDCDNSSNCSEVEHAKNRRTEFKVF